MKKYTKSQDTFYTICGTHKIVDCWSGLSEWFKIHEFVKCALLEDKSGEQFYLFLTL